MNRRPIVITALIFAFAVAGPAQVRLPDTPVGKRVAAFLEMLRSTSDEALGAFITSNMTPNPDLTLPQRIARFKGIRSDLNGATLAGIARATDRAADIVLTLPSGERRGMTIEIDDEDPERRIGGIARNSAVSTAAPDQRKLSERELVPEVEKVLAKLVADDQFSGAVLIAKGGEPVFQKAYGMADKEKKVANTLNTKFNIGSQNKIFTMLAVGMLADEGKLSFSDTLGKHLPDYPNKDAANKVTIHHLLTMTSGIGDFYGPEYDRTPKEKFQSNKDYLPLFASKPLEFEPGARSRYSNGGYIILGVIIEKLSGKSYYDFVKDRIFKPIGMTSTDSYSTADKVADIAMGYTFRSDNGEDSKVRRSNLDTRPARGSSAGGGYSTVGDMLKFVNAVESGRFVVPKSVMATPDRAVGGMFTARGMGFGGGAPGINSALASKVGGSYTIVVMSNYDPPTAERVLSQIRNWLTPTAN